MRSPSFHLPLQRTKKRIIAYSVLAASLIMCPAIHVIAQKKPLDHSDFAIWKQIANVNVSGDGAWVSYVLEPGEGDPELKLYDINSGEERAFPRGRKASFTFDSRFLVYVLSPPGDSVKAMRRRDVEKEDLPGDSLIVYNLTTREQAVYPGLHNYKIPEKWAGIVALTIDPPQDSTSGKYKKYSKENGYPLVIHNLLSEGRDTLDYVTEFEIAESGASIAAVTSGKDSILSAGVYAYDMDDGSWKALQTQEGSYQKLTFDKRGQRLAFLGDTDTTKARIRPHDIFHWTTGMDSAVVLVPHPADFMDEEWIISPHRDLHFSDAGQRLFFGIAPPPLLEDTTLLEEEIVRVEVWHYLDKRMYTQQNVRLDRERERSYLAAVDLSTGEAVAIAGTDTPGARLDPDYNSPVVVLYDARPYLREMSWEGITKRDIYAFDMRDQTQVLLRSAVDGMPSLSPGYEYIYWYSRSDSTWTIMRSDGSDSTDSRSIPTPVYHEIHDRPIAPRAYGVAGWTKGDESILIYDRYDIWRFDPAGAQPPVNLTQGRDTRLRYRYIDLEPDEHGIDPDRPLLLHVFDEGSKASGYAHLDLRTGDLELLIMDDYDFTQRVHKARDTGVLVFTKESFRKFPDLQITTDRFVTHTQISHANPQQQDYLWGDIELYTWTDFDGRERQGLLVKPDNLDTSKPYPAIVNFYERSTDGLHRHRTPFPHRSTINYPFYASRGYVIFNPDVHYRSGFPGESAINAVVSGTEALLEEGFIDPGRIGLQGHSWGGYQIAYIITKTDMFACAEAGAPVVNMISAYGGIRWQTGLSRMFQYERTQSRLGATLWERPDLYIENSPIFELDKVTTPVLILHNDQDGHVPWYQGIEFFVAMRRLGKPAWLLNYVDEPHWPLKLQNRKDLNIRMQQFFDHYLKGEPMPQWMHTGVPAVEKGILQGYELIRE